MLYVIEVKDVPPCAVVSERRKASREHVADIVHATLAEVAPCVAAVAADPLVPFAVYHDEALDSDCLEVEIGFPLSGAPVVTESAYVRRGELPGGPMACTTHVGPYTTIADAYAALYAWIASNGRARPGPRRESFLVGPLQTTNTGAFRTEVAVPVDPPRAS